MLVRRSLRLALRHTARTASGAAQSQPPEDRRGGGRKNHNTGSAAPRTAHAMAEHLDKEVQKHVSDVQRESSSPIGGYDQDDKFHMDWRDEPGHKVPYKFRLSIEKRSRDQKGTRTDAELKEQALKTNPYTGYTGLRFPTLETAENFDYHQPRGLNRVDRERAFPIKVPGHRRLDPYFREYIHFLHTLDPVRFTIARIAERYRLREGTIAKVVQEWGTNRYLTRSGLVFRLADKQSTREAEILKAKEQQYARWVGWDQLGDEEDAESDDESLGDYKGWRATADWVRRQTVEVEMMSAFPMMEKRSPMPKFVDHDLTVGHGRGHKIIKWIDPTDKVVF